METQQNISEYKKFHLKNISSSQDSSLEQAIKKNNVKTYLRKGVSDISNLSVSDDPRSETLEDHLLQLKNSCSNLRRQIKNRESQTQKLRNEALFANDKKKKIQNQKYDIQVKIAEFQKKLDQVNSKRDVASHSCKTYQHILERMKKDDIFYQLKNNQLSRQIKQLQTSLNFTQAKNYSTSQMQKLSMNGLKDAQQQLKNQKSLRKAKVQNFNDQTNKKKDQKEKLKDQQMKTEKIRELADEIQDAQLMRIKKFLQVQVFLKQLLKNKMNKLKNHYQSQYQSFFLIKSRTSVKDANSLKYQFFNFQSAYNQKTVWVKHIEEQIETAKNQTKQLKRRLVELQNDEMQMLEKSEQKDTSDKRIRKQELIEKSLEYELIWEKIKTWLHSQAQKLEIDTKNNDDLLGVFGQISRKIKIDNSIQSEQGQKK